MPSVVYYIRLRDVTVALSRFNYMLSATSSVVLRISLTVHVVSSLFSVSPLWSLRT